MQQSVVYYITVVSRVSTHGHLNITRDFGLHRRYPGYNFHTFVQKLLSYMGVYQGVGGCPGHYGTIVVNNFMTTLLTDEPGIIFKTLHPLATPLCSISRAGMTSIIL